MGNCCTTTGVGAVLFRITVPGHKKKKKKTIQAPFRFSMQQRRASKNVAMQRRANKTNTIEKFLFLADLTSMGNAVRCLNGQAAAAQPKCPHRLL